MGMLRRRQATDGGRPSFTPRVLQIAVALLFVAQGTAWSQSLPTAPTRATCTNPQALGVARTVQIDTTGGPGFGFEHFKQHDFLRDREVVLTFDDGPWSNNTPAVLKALADECTTGIFFIIGKHATYYPEILKQVYSAGHTIGGHTWSHVTLSNKNLTEQQRKDEIERGFSAAKWALDGIAPEPFFRFPALQHPPEMVSYLGQRNVAIVSTDIDSFDFKDRSPPKIVDNVMRKLEKTGKGIILMHDFNKPTAEALPELLKRLKAANYKVVEMKARERVQTIPSYDNLIVSEAGPRVNPSQETSKIVTTLPHAAHSGAAETATNTSRPNVAAIGDVAVPAERRLALVIGNSRYANFQSLPNPRNDANDLASVLRNLGFEVILGTDLNRTAMEDVLQDFGRKARTADAALVYFAGHGIQHQGVNYLTPIDAKLTDETDLRRLFNLQDVIGDLQTAGRIRILIVDACRDNQAVQQLASTLPKTRSAAFTRGMARVEPDGTLVAFATQANKTANDGNGRNSPFTQALLARLQESGVELRTLMTRVRQDVVTSTNGVQRPEVWDSLIGEFTFRPKT